MPVFTWVSNASHDGKQPWRKGLKVGLPVATGYYTRCELMDRGIIGLYMETTAPVKSRPVSEPVRVADLCRSPQVL